MFVAVAGAGSRAAPAQDDQMPSQHGAGDPTPSHHGAAAQPRLSRRTSESVSALSSAKANAVLDNIGLDWCETLSPRPACATARPTQR